MYGLQSLNIPLLQWYNSIMTSTSVSWHPRVHCIEIDYRQQDYCVCFLMLWLTSQIVLSYPVCSTTFTNWPSLHQWIIYATSIIHLCSLRISVPESFLSTIQYMNHYYAGAGLFVAFAITFRLCVTLRRPVMT